MISVYNSLASCESREQEKRLSSTRFVKNRKPSPSHTKPFIRFDLRTKKEHHTGNKEWHSKTGFNDGGKRINSKPHIGVIAEKVD